MPVYNVCKYIEKALNSALNQSFQEPYEIIIIDDCTPDNSIEIVYEVLKNHHRASCVQLLKHTINKGQSAARNLGLKEAKGDYIFFFDGDDEMKPEALDLLYNQMVRLNPDFVCGETDVTNEKKNPIRHTDMFVKNGEYIEKNQHIFEKRILGDWSLTPWNKLMKKSFLINNDLYFYEGIYYEDLLWSVCVAIKANKIAFIPEITYTYLLHENSTSSILSEKHINSFLIETKELYQIILSQKLFEKYGKIVLRLFELNRKLVLDWTIPKVPKKCGKMILNELRKYNLKSLKDVWMSDQLNFKLKLYTTAFYLNKLAYLYVKLLAYGGKFIKYK